MRRQCTGEFLECRRAGLFPSTTLIWDGRRKRASMLTLVDKSDAR
jgi:hypothetical protein